MRQRWRGTDEQEHHARQHGDGLPPRHRQHAGTGGVAQIVEEPACPADRAGRAIGTGLFYGSSESIALAGPSILLAYLVGGLAIFMIVRALGEMSVEDPRAGAFSYYATRYWSKRAGFVSGWNYWFNYILVSMVELSVVGKFVNYWFPAIPTWVSAAVFLVIICAAQPAGRL